MTLAGWTLILGFIALVALIARPLGFYLALLTAFSFLDLVVMDFSCFDD